MLTEAPEGGWGLGGHANTNAELVSAVRGQIAELSKNLAWHITVTAPAGPAWGDRTPAVRRLLWLACW